MEEIKNNQNVENLCEEINNLKDELAYLRMEVMVTYLRADKMKKNMQKSNYKTQIVSCLREIVQNSREIKADIKSLKSSDIKEDKSVF